MAEDQKKEILRKIEEKERLQNNMKKDQEQMIDQIK
jgi:hypothetical protein